VALVDISEFSWLDSGLLDLEVTTRIFASSRTHANQPKTVWQAVFRDDEQFPWLDYFCSVGHFLTIAFFLKPGVAKIALCTLAIPVFVDFGVGLILTAYLRMIP
jgi:hypothetical protein